MSNPSSNRNETIIRSVLFVAVVVAAVGLIIFLKHSSDVPLTPEGFAARDSANRMAKPDTSATNAEEYPMVEPDSTVVPDSVSMDLRLPSDAGYEDGYIAGLQDGIYDMERASYDDSSKFPTPAQRRNYTDAYKRGYAQGFADGQNQGEEEKKVGTPPEAESGESAPKSNAAPSTPHAAPAHSHKPTAPAKPAATPAKKS